MELVVQIHDRYKARKFFEFLTALDFVQVIKATDRDEEEENHEGVTETVDFFSYAGLWANREVTLDTLRQHAWRHYTR